MASEARGGRRRGRKPHLLASGPPTKTRRGRPRPAGATARPPQSRTVRPAVSRSRQCQRAGLQRRRDLTIPARARRDAQGSTGSGQGRLRCGRFGGISAPPSCSYASCPLRGWCAPRCYLRPGAADQGGCTGGTRSARQARAERLACAGCAVPRDNKRHCARAVSVDGRGASGDAGGERLCWRRSAGGLSVATCVCADAPRRAQATEDFMVHLLEDCNLCAIHAKRVTISAPLHRARAALCGLGTSGSSP